MLREKDSQMRDLLTKFEEINDKLTESLQNQKEGSENQKRLEQRIADLQLQLLEKVAEITILKYDNATLKARLEIKQKQQFGTKSHDRRTQCSHFQHLHPDLQTGGSTLHELLQEGDE